MACRHPSQQRCLVLGCMHDKVTDETVLEIAKKSPQIRKLDLTYCSKLSSRGLVSLFQLLPALQELSLRRCDVSLTDTVLIRCAQLCPLLEILDLSFCHRLTDASIVKVAEHCTRLRVLEIYKCSQLGNTSILALSDKCPLLETLNIGYVGEISVTSVLRLMSGCPNLNTLDLHSCADSSMEQLHTIVQNRGPGIRSLSIPRNVAFGKSECRIMQTLYPAVEFILGSPKPHIKES